MGEEADDEEYHINLVLSQDRLEDQGDELIDINLVAKEENA